MTKASTAVTTLLLITASSSGGEKHRIQRQHSTPTSPTTPERSRVQSDLARRTRVAARRFPRRQRSEDLFESVGTARSTTTLLQTRGDISAESSGGRLKN